MKQFVVIALATCAALGILIHFLGSSRMASTAVTIPGTEHTPAFGLTWTLVVGGVVGFAIWRIVKGK